MPDAQPLPDAWISAAYPSASSKIWETQARASSHRHVFLFPIGSSLVLMPCGEKSKAT